MEHERSNSAFQCRRRVALLVASGLPPPPLALQLCVMNLQEWTSTDALWNGPRESLESAAARLHCNVSLTSDAAAILNLISPSLLLTLPGQSSPLVAPYNVSSTLLLPALAVSRAVKVPQEIELIAAATSASLRAHAVVQQHAAPGDSEGEIAALFRFSNEDCGLPFQA